MEVVELEVAVLRCARLRAHSRQHVCVWDSSPLSKHTPEAPGHESLLLLIVFFIYKEGMHRSGSPAVLAVLMKVVFPFTLFLFPVNVSLCLTMICIMTAGYFVLQFASCYHFKVQLRTTLPLFLFAFFFPLSSYMKALAPHTCLFSAAWALVNEPDLNEAFKAVRTCYSAKAVCCWGHILRIFFFKCVTLLSTS